MQSSDNFFFRPQTETQSAQWEFITNTLFIPMEFSLAGTAKIRTDLQPYEINTLIHELDHAEKDLRNDLLQLRGKSLAGKIHAGVCWGALLCLLGLVTTTMLGSLHRLRRFLPSMGRMSRLAFLASPHFALGVVAGSTALGVAFALVYHSISPAEISDRSRMEEQNLLQVMRISRILDTHTSQEMDVATAALAQEETMPRRIREAIRLAVLRALGGAALGLLLGWLSLGDRLLGKRRILRALSYPWALAVTCALIGMLGLGSVGAWQTNRIAKIKAWEISGYYSGDCAHQVLEGLQDIAHYNAKLLHGLSLADLKQLRFLDEQGQLKLLLPQRMYRMPAGQRSLPENPLAQLAFDFPGELKRFGAVRPNFEAYLVGTVIDFPYGDHPQIFESLFRTSLGLELDRMTLDRARDQFNYRGLADFIERSDLAYCAQVRDQARAKLLQELSRVQ